MVSRFLRWLRRSRVLVTSDVYWTVSSAEPTDDEWWFAIR